MKDVLYPDNAGLRVIYVIAWLVLMGLLFYIAFGAQEVEVMVSVIVVALLLMLSHIHMMFMRR
jgi:hypothetical protein